MVDMQKARGKNVGETQFVPESQPFRATLKYDRLLQYMSGHFYINIKLLLWEEIPGLLGERVEYHELKSEENLPCRRTASAISNYFKG